VAKGPSVSVVREVVRLGVRGAQSSLDGWMRQNFTALKEELKPHRTNWEALAARLSQEGLTNSSGKKLTAATARKTWQRVRAEMDSPEASPPTPKAPVAPEPPEPRTLPAVPPVEPEPYVAPRFEKTRPARMRGLPPKE
jgi:hypothetical protein